MAFLAHVRPGKSTSVSSLQSKESNPGGQGFDFGSAESAEESRSIISEPKIRKFKSAKLVGEYEKPWLADKSYTSRERIDRIILWICTLIGCGIAAAICFKKWNELPVFDYCLVLEDTFTEFNTETWSREVGVGGYGYGSFDWTTDDPKNSYVDEAGLHIVPTLTLETTNFTAQQMYNGSTLNLTADGSCTSPALIQCVMISNVTNGTIINPVRSARLTTAGKISLQYGRVEVIAKMPKGDWLWPSIWMYPEQETYGPWPRSGEIDIAHIRGNSPETYPNGRDTVNSYLHWGVADDLDESAKTSGKLTLRRQDLSEGFHTYGMEWSGQHFFTWIDDRAYRVEQTGFGASFGGDMYQRAGYGNEWINGKLPPNVWSETGLYNTPFDKPFHLILNVAVGASNGFFPDTEGHKPWIDGSSYAMRDFWYANSTWLPTWGPGEDRGMTVKSVKMWQQGKCGSQN